MASILRKILIIGFVVSLMMSNIAFARSFRSEEDILDNQEFNGLYRTSKGEVRMIKEDNNDAPRVYKWTGRKYAEVKDPFNNFVWNVSHVKTTGFTIPTANLSGKSFYAGKKTFLYKYDKKGKITIKFDIKKSLKGYEISKV